MQKSYQSMSHDERVAVIGQLADYRQRAIPQLKSAGRFFSPQMRELFFEGVSLLGYFPQAHSFCVEASAIKTNFDQYANRMMYLMNIVIEQITGNLAVRTPSGEQVIIMSPTQSLRRGRPTALESERRRQEKEQAQLAEVVSRLSGARIIQPPSDAIDMSRPSDTSRRKDRQQGPDLFSSALSAIADLSPSPDDQSPITAPTELPASPVGQQPSSAAPTNPTQSPSSPSSLVCGDAIAAPSSSAPSSSAPSSSAPAPIPNEAKSLREWSWILPDHLAQQIKALRDIRAEMAAESEKAKSLFEQGATPADVAVHARRAKELNRQISSLYADVDAYLAMSYLMLTKVNKDYGRWAERYARHGGYEVLLHDLFPYYTKLAVSNPGQEAHLLDEARRLESARLAREKRDPEKEKRIHAIKAYFSRKDVLPTPERLQQMRNRYEEARQLGLDADTLAGFQVFIDSLAASLSNLNS